MPSPVAWLEAPGQRQCPDSMSALNIKTSLGKSDGLERVFMFREVVNKPARMNKRCVRSKRSTTINNKFYKYTDKKL